MNTALNERTTHKHRQHRVGLAVALLVVAAAAWGCDEGEGDTAPEPTITLDTTDHALEISFDADESGFIVMCTDFVKVYKGEGAAQVRLGKSALMADAWDGYYLDGLFVPPIPGEGCDILSCDALAGEMRTVVLAEYEKGEDHVFTDEEKASVAAAYLASAHGENIPDSVATYVSVPYSGPVSIEITYFPNAACDDGSANGATVTKTFSAE